jgi:hypothetical protein
MAGTPGRQTRRGTFAALALLFYCGVAPQACGDSGSSAGGSTSAPGNTVVNDTRDAEPRPPANPDPGDGSTLTGEPDALDPGEAGYATDAPAVSYPGIAECNACTCPPASAFCFGGATSRQLPMTVNPFAAADAGLDAGLPLCPMVAPGALGCTPLPAGATDCASLISGLQASYACYLVCAFDGKQMTAYCPNP